MSADGPGLGELITLGLALALTLAVGFGLGWLVDLWTGTFPAFAFVGFLVGLLSAGRTVYKQSKKYM